MTRAIARQPVKVCIYVYILVCQMVVVRTMINCCWPSMFFSYVQYESARSYPLCINLAIKNYIKYEIYLKNISALNDNKF